MLFQHPNSNLSEKITYANDAGLLPSNIKNKKLVKKAVENLLPLQKLKMNQDKTKHALLERRERKIMKNWSWPKEL